MKFAAVLLLVAVSGALQSQEISHETEARVTLKVDPEYTKEAADAKLEGTVILAAVIDAGGMATEIRVVKGLGQGLDEKAIECLRQWRFRPATRYGEAISTKATVEINFRLAGLKSPNPK